MKLPMSAEALTALLEQPLVAKLATQAEDGGIRMTPLWFKRDSDGSLLFATWEKTAAVRNIRSRPRCSVLIDYEGGEPYYGVHFDGAASIEGPEDDVEAITAVYGPYKASLDEACDAARSLIADGRMVFIRFVPEKTTSWDFR